MDYTSLKTLHISCVALSISLFVLRGMLQFGGVNWRQWRILRIAPHLVDTLLLGSAIWLAITIGQYPFMNSWLTAKVIALFAYVYFGKLSLQAPTTPAREKLRLPAFVAALLCVTYIVGVAVNHSPSWGFTTA